MRFPDNAPYVAIVITACCIGAAFVIAIAMTADKLCALHFVALC